MHTDGFLLVQKAHTDKSWMSASSEWSPADQSVYKDKRVRQINVPHSRNIDSDCKEHRVRHCNPKQ